MTGRSFMLPLIILLRLAVTTVLSDDVTCQPCALPHPGDIQWLSAAKPPCFHPGQPVFQWPRSENCSSPDEILSEFISVDDEGTVFAKKKLCFYYAYEVIPYSFRCGNIKDSASFRLGHPIFSKQRRFKRWLRRRNPNSASIHFQQERYIKELPEDSAVGTVVASVKATHANGQPIYYSMVAPQDARSQNIFSLDTVTGDVRLAKSLDRETLDKHVLKVTAYERVDPTVSTSTTVVVDVLDVQDNSPVFERDSYFADIREDAPIGTTVLSVFARDLDAGENGRLEYSLGTGEGAAYLTINPKSGVVQTAASLDRETLSLIRLDVIATDHGDPPRKSSALVEVGVLDVNDNAPVFERDSYNVSILENSTVPIVVATVSATDKDAGVHGQVHYSIVASSPVPLTIDYSTGEVTLREKVDAKSSPLTLLVRAKDGAQPALTSTVALTLHIVDINDHAPRFIASQKQIFLEENVPVGEEVGKVYAIDDDSGANGHIRYSLSGSDDFEIDPESGVIKTAKPIDREKTAHYELTITASDHGEPPLTTSTSMSVSVKDVNDNTPVFEQSIYNVSLSEDMERGTHVVTLKAHDKDEKQKIVYRIEKTDKDVVALMDLGDQGAMLTLSGRLHSADQHIRVEVSATDQGGLQGRCIVNLIVDDVNSPPQFLEHPFSVRIPEDAPIGFPVVLLKAVDHDRGTNAEVTYFLDSQHFDIDNKTGQVSLAAPLDRENRASYSLIVSARDSAEPPLNTTTLVEVVLEDVNDNPPVFSSEKYMASIPEDIAVGTSFLQVSAVDLDSGTNGIVDYFLNESDPMVALDLFRLDRTSGTLRVNSKLDREQQAIVHLPVIAKDRGHPSLSASSLISVTLLDVNDNAPQFSQPSYDLYIAENSPIGSVVGTIAAHDADEDENSHIEFRIFGGTDAKLFDLEVDGEQPGVVRILTRAEFDYEAKTNRFYLEVQASSGQLSSTVSVRVHVSDVNDNRPILKDFLVLLTRYEDDAISKDIGTIPAFDPDQNATLEFFLEENEVLNVDKISGRLEMNQAWKRNIDASFRTCVSDGPNTVCASCRLVHVHAKKEWLREAVTMKIKVMGLDDFWDPAVFDRLRQSIATLDSWDPSAIQVLSAEQASSGNGIVASIAVVNKERIVKSWSLAERIRADVARLEKLSLLRLTVVEEESCNKEPCPYFQKCRQTLKFVNSQQVHQTDNFLARTLKTLNTFVCECPTGFASSEGQPNHCDIRMDQCFNQPCANNATCVALESGFRCDCNGPWRGDRCDIPTTAYTCLPGYCQSGAACELAGSRMMCRHCKYGSQDTDGRCRLRSLSFGGDGLVNINKEPGRFQWEMEFRIATVSHDSVILFSGDKNHDFLEIGIQERTLRAEFSLGGRSQVVQLEAARTNRVNDGEWHTVKVVYYDRTLSLMLDGCDPFVAHHAHGAPPCAAQARLELKAKCVDPTVPCFRFLDLSNGIFLGGRPAPQRQVASGYRGCISNLTLDGTLIDFSDFSNLDKVGNVREGCNHKRDFCSEQSCPEGAKCINRWDGHNCRCGHSVHGTIGCPTDSGKALTLSDDESFVSFHPEGALVPFTLSFEFRTSRVDTQLFAMEFDRKNMFYKVELDDGLYRVSLGQTSVIVAAPEFQPGHWVRIDVDFGEDDVTTTVDGLHPAGIKTSLLEMTAEAAYTGLAPSTGHPSRFDGCLRGVSINGSPLSVKEKGKVRAGCVAGNRCGVEGVCPKESRCHRHWDRHQCLCHRGFVGDTCLPVCSLRGICGADGFCQTTNSTKGYECQCQNGMTGPNCQQTTTQQQCPEGWWGAFPNCKQCQCDGGKGFMSQCNKSNGECQCPKNQYLLRGRCVPCECGLGSASLECSSSGQCTCSGQAVGRRCDRCSLANQVFEPRSLKCVPIRDRCPSEIENGIQWPTTIKGATARASCKGVETGLATRVCGPDSRWHPVNNWNCTRPEYAVMVNKYDFLDSSELLRLLHNATRNDEIISGRNFEISRSAALRIVQNELRQEAARRSHVHDVAFSETLVVALGKLLASETPLEYLSLVRKVEAYGSAVFETHSRIGFLEPFAVATPEILFAVDRLDFGNVFPKFNNFLDKRPVDFPSVDIVVEGAEKIFYSIIAAPRCVRCESLVVTVIANTTKPIRVEFPLNEENGWRYPECVKLHGASWTTRDSSLVGLNMSHAACEFVTSGTFSLVVKTDKAAYLHLAHSDGIASPVLAGIALLLCLFSFIATLVRKQIRTRLIRLGFIFFFAAAAINIYLVHKVAVNQVFCPVRNAVLTFTAVTPFAWLFLYSLHIYRMLANANTNASVIVCLLVGVIMPCIMACGSFVFASQCTLLPAGWLFWMLAIPIGLFLLLSFYAAATSLLISLNKQYDMIVVKFNLRKALFQHFVLSALTLVSTAIGLFLPLFAISTPMQELVVNISLVVTALFILVWSFSPGANSGSPASLWLEPQKEIIDLGPGIHSPLLGTEESDALPVDWMPDIVPADPYRTSTPRRSRDTPPHMRENPLTNTILSPAEKILNDGFGHVYGNMGTLPRFRSDQEEADDAYYTYTAQRRPHVSTFNRH